jgi:hypothetical protein
MMTKNEKYIFNPKRKKKYGHKKREKGKLFSFLKNGQKKCPKSDFPKSLGFFYFFHF